VTDPADWTGPLHERPGLFARKDEIEEEVLVLPPPERLAAPTEALPRTGSGIVKALGSGWNYRVLAARGPVVRTRKVTGQDGKNKNVKTPEMADSTTLRLRHTDGRAAVVVWIDGKFDSAYAWRVCTDPTCPRGTVDHPADMPAALGAREVKALVET
jgi:hypothetical protein